MVALIGMIMLKSSYRNYAFDGSKYSSGRGTVASMYVASMKFSRLRTKSDNLLDYDFSSHCMGPYQSTLAHKRSWMARGLYCFGSSLATAEHVMVSFNVMQRAHKLVPQTDNSGPFHRWPLFGGGPPTPRMCFQ
ncbi:hypothetical protein WN944_004776 [Citrus x changshan-huyou]|uniref:Uncharacterized protein n=1 Tax=Citrus x changshan-huyou TaxID=2935761 RepID=A0AAP0M5M6_9ROSI